MLDLKGKKIILASASPRRQNLLKGLDIDFTIEVRPTDEHFPEDLKREAIPEFLAKQKAEQFTYLADDTIIITSDTIVWINDHVMNKPEDMAEAKRMLQTISGQMHEVFTAVCLTTKNKQKVFSVASKVYFKPLEDAEIDYYLANYTPLDKAGSYGIQEWIGYIGIEKIDGSYFNVMGLPLKELYEELSTF